MFFIEVEGSDGEVKKLLEHVMCLSSTLEIPSKFQFDFIRFYDFGINTIVVGTLKSFSAQLKKYSFELRFFFAG